MPSKKLPMRPPGNTPGEEYLAALYTRLELKLPKAFATRLKAEAEARETPITRLIIETMCERFGWPVPPDRRRSE
jgi:hypothetical protein